MSLPKNTTRQEIIKSTPARIENYNSNIGYNSSYLHFITERDTGIKSSCSLEKWLVTPEAADLIHSFINDFGMKSYQLTPPVVYSRNLFELTVSVDVEGLSKFTPYQGPLTTLVAIQQLHKNWVSSLILFKWRRFSEAGGIVVGSKVAHAILPELCPMIDTRHRYITLILPPVNTCPW